MASENTGIVIPTQLRFYDPPIPPGTPTAIYVANTPGQEGYIAPYEDTNLCDVEYGTDCPEGIKATGITGGVIRYTFSLPNSVVKNPNINTIRVEALLSSIPDGTFVDYTLPKTIPNIFDGSLNSLTSGNHTLQISYFGPGSILVATCNDGVLINVP